MKSSLFLSLVLLLALWGCSPIDKSTLINTGKGTVPQKAWESPFMGMFEKSLFRTTMDIREFHLTGYTIIKKSGDTSYRIVFANDIGMTIFDVEFLHKKFISHYIFAPMQKKALLKIIEADLRALMFYAFTTNDATHFMDKEKQVPVLYLNPPGTYYFIDPQTFHVTEIAGGTNPWDRYRITFEYPTNTFVQKIRLDNQGIGLIIKLNWISQ
jgi:hypothetical protein